MKFILRLSACILCIIMILSLASISVGAKTVYPSGDWVYEMINDNTEFEIDEYTGSASIVSTMYAHINLNITSIGKHAFYNNASLSEIYVNDPITRVSSFAFLDCSNLTTVVLNNSLSIIGTGSFAGCSALKDINLQDTQVRAINASAFGSCTSLQEIVLPNTVASIGENAFAYCDGLTKITIPKSVTEIHEKAFYNTPNVVIYCYEDSTAHLFAEENSIEYVLLDPPVTYILGDVDNSGEVSILDATEVQLLIAQLVEPQDEYTQLRADIDSDGVLSIMDATSIQMYIAGYEVEEPIGETFEV